MLNWWADIFKWCELEKPVWELADSILEKFYGSAMRELSYEMLKEAIISAPIDLATKWANIMMKTVDRSGMSIIFNASIERKELKKFALIFLDILKKDPKMKEEMEYNSKLLELEEIGDEIGNKEIGNKYRKDLLDYYIELAKSISDRKSKLRSLLVSGGEKWGQFFRVDWSVLENNEWESINHSFKHAVTNSFILDEEFLNLLLIWSQIARNQEQKIIDESGELLLDKILKIQISSSESRLMGKGGPFSTFSINFDIKDVVQHARIVSVSLFLPKVSKKVMGRMLSWLQDEIPNTEEVNLPIIWEAMIRIFTIGQSDLSAWALNGFKAVYARISSDVDLLSKGINRIHEVFNLSENKGPKIIDILKDNNPEAILSVIDRAIEKVINSLNPEGRRASALILNLLSQRGMMNKKEKSG